MYEKEINCTNTNNGYWYFCDSKHPLADVNTRVYLHRHLASIKYGRWLSHKEHVHHIDGNKLNNELDNLLLLSNSEHARIHTGGIATEFICKNCGTKFISGKLLRNYCSKQCRNAGQIKSKISREELDNLIPNNTWSSLGKLLGYTDNGIKKRAKVLGCDLLKIRKHTIGTNETNKR